MQVKTVATAKPLQLKDLMAWHLFKMKNGTGCYIKLPYTSYVKNCLGNPRDGFFAPVIEKESETLTVISFEQEVEDLGKITGIEL
jgi:hypothetical protein